MLRYFHKILRINLFIFLPKKLIIFLLNSNFIFFRVIIFLLGYRDLQERLIKNCLKIKEIRSINIQNLFLLRNIECELLQNNSKNLIPFIENHLIKYKDLSIQKSFHFTLFKYFDENEKLDFNELKLLDYFNFHKSISSYKSYNRDDNWVKDRILRCHNLFNSIKRDGLVLDYKNLPIILDKPLISQRYNIKYKINGFEVFDGHHRVACASVLGYDCIKCFICTDNILK